MSGANMANSVQETFGWMKVTLLDCALLLLCCESLYSRIVVVVTQDDFPKETTTIPEIVIAEEAATGSLAVVIVSAILSITLLFLVAIFIDCRHQKMKNGKLGSKMFKISLPRFGVPRIDRETIADKMEANVPTAAPTTTVIV